MGCGSSTPTQASPAPAGKAPGSAAATPKTQYTEAKTAKSKDDTPKNSEVPSEVDNPTGKEADVDAGDADMSTPEKVTQTAGQDDLAVDKSATEPDDGGLDAGRSAADVTKGAVYAVGDATDATDDAYTAAPKRKETGEDAVVYGTEDKDGKEQAPVRSKTGATADEDDGPQADGELELPYGEASMQAPATEPSAIKSKTSDAFD